MNPTKDAGIMTIPSTASRATCATRCRTPRSSFHRHADRTDGRKQRAVTELSQAFALAVPRIFAGGDVRLGRPVFDARESVV